MTISAIVSDESLVAVARQWIDDHPDDHWDPSTGSSQMRFLWSAELAYRIAHRSVFPDAYDERTWLERLTFPSAVPDGEPVVYLHLGPLGEVVYVGKTCHYPTRQAAHRARSGWFPEVSSIEVKWCGTRRIMDEVERELIATHRPRYNVVGVPR